MKRISILGSTLAACACAAIQALAQMPVPPRRRKCNCAPAAELDQMLGPIALYPDPLIAQILPAATLPSEIVLADRYVNGGGDPNLIDQQPWDPSVKALARYPTVLKWMDDNLAWTTALGQAFLYQQQDVMDSIQRLRAQAQALGNLQTTPQENVVTDNGTIEILPANPQVIYVPVYQPDVVYFQRPYGTPVHLFRAGLARWAHGSTTTLIGTITTSSSGAMTSRVQPIGGLAAPANVPAWRRPTPPSGNRATVPRRRRPELGPRLELAPGPQHGNCNRGPIQAGGTPLATAGATGSRRQPNRWSSSIRRKRPARGRPTAHSLGSRVRIRPSSLAAAARKAARRLHPDRRRPPPHSAAPAHSAAPKSPGRRRKTLIPEAQ